ncbi:MAG: hypothetical protein ABJA81_04055 [Nocardioidaceae bacterium]
MTASPSGVPGKPVPASDAWYLARDRYWVAADADPPPPFRHGDLFHTPAVNVDGVPLATSDGSLWHAAMVLSPSCKLVSKVKDDDPIEVARVVPLSIQPPKEAAAIAAGWQEKDGRLRVAFAHTVFLAGVPESTSHTDGMFAHLKTTTRVRMRELRAVGRIAALDHDARVSVIRRELYYRYRWLISMDDVGANEATRISCDPHFAEPRPDWGEFIGHRTTGSA